MKWLYDYSDITEVTPLPDLRLKIALKNGSGAIISFNHKVGQARFFVLTKEGIWESAKPRKAANIYWTRVIGERIEDSLGVPMHEAVEIALEKEGRKEDEPLISGVLPLPRFLLQISLQNGSELSVNMRSWMITAQYNKLRKESVWESAKTDGENIIWSNGIRMTMDEALEMFAARL